MADNDLPAADFGEVYWRTSPVVPHALPVLSPALIDEGTFRLLADTIPTLCWVANGDGYIVWYNRRWHDYCGTTPAQMEGWGWQAVHDPTLLPEVMRGWEVSLATGQPFQMTFPLRGADGKFRPFLTRVQPMRDATGKVARWFGVNTGISEQVAVEARLRDSEAFTRLLLNSTSEAFYSIDTTGITTSCNRAFLDITGFATERDVVGRRLHDVIHHSHPNGAHYDVNDCPIYAAARLGTSAHVTDEVFFRADGNAVPVEYRAEPILRDGVLVGAICTFADITERRRAEDALRDLNDNLARRVEQAVAERSQVEDALRQAQKMEAVGQLTGGIAHDFNNMLAVMMGSLDLLDRRLSAEDARSRRYVEAALDGARRAALLTERLLAFSRQQPLRPEAIDANQLVSGMSDLLGRALGGSVRLETILGAQLWHIHADPNQLENVILNLAVNARDAMPEGGVLTIETANVELPAADAALPPGMAAGSYVGIAVSDTGCGMLPEVIAKAFDPFFTTKEVGKGTGLGLSQVHGFVSQSGGHIQITSQPGQGTTVQAYLPRLQHVPPPRVPEAHPAIAPGGTPQECILVVEDEPGVRQFSVQALIELGYGVLEADGAAAALALLDTHPLIAAMFTDVVMPDVNGRKLAEVARRRRPDLKILFTTGYARDAAVHNFVLEPDVELIGKPFSVEQLALKIRAVLDRPAPKPTPE